MNTIQVASKKKNFSEARSSKSVKKAENNSPRKGTLGEELILVRGSTFVSDVGSLGDAEKLAKRIKRPNRNHPINCAETRELASDPEFMECFRRGVKELDEGKGVSWKEAKKKLGL